MEMYRGHLETLTSKMQVFCLDPSYKDFVEICDYPKLRNEQGPSFDIWRDCCIMKYGKYWPITDGFDEVAFAKNISRLKTRLSVSPRRSSLDQMWFCFFATGELEYLECAYQVGGDSSLGEDAVTIYYDIRKTYESYLSNYDWNNWNQHATVRAAADRGVMLEPSAKTVFASLDKLIQDHINAMDLDTNLSDAGRRQLEQYQEDADILAKKFSSMPIETNSSESVSSNSTQTARLKKANAIFDELAAKVVIKKK